MASAADEAVSATADKAAKSLNLCISRPLMCVVGTQLLKKAVRGFEAKTEQ
ncbi:hypothetical protein [Pelagibius marinus]|uniref:hypothetical protein n=1 Tax=Pelagibius marinus TaxID=2762760 RepID=UPI0018730EBE|nr:hypothetical protein [Pelagibius marinus]